MSLGLIQHIPFQRPRSAEPVLSLSRSSAFEDDIADLWFDTYGRGAQAWLPNIYYESAVRREDVKSLFERWLSDSPAIDDDGVDPLTWEEVYDAFTMLNELAQDRPIERTEDHTARRVMLDLEDAMGRDNIEYMSSPWKHSGMSTLGCQRLFRSLAEVSYYCRSRPLGNVLYKFFIRHVGWVVGHSNTLSIYLWCQAVLRSEMALSSRYSCIRSVAQLQPELFASFSFPPPAGVSELQDRLQDLIETVRERNRSSETQHSNPYGRRIYEIESERPPTVFGPNDRQVARLYSDVKYHEDRVRRGKQKLAQLTGGPALMEVPDSNETGSRSQWRSRFRPDWDWTRRLHM